MNRSKSKGNQGDSRRRGRQQIPTSDQEFLAETQVGISSPEDAKKFGQTGAEKSPLPSPCSAEGAKTAKISSLEVKKRTPDLCIIHLDSGEQVTLRLEVAMANRLEKGREIGAALLGRLLREDELSRCRQRAWRLLSLRPRTALEMRRALRQRGFFAQTIEQVVGDLETRGFINDASFARAFVQERVQRRHGPRLIAQELSHRGVAQEAAQEALQPAVPRERQGEDVEALLEKWNRRSKPEDPRKRAQAAAAFLLRRGFDPDVVWAGIRSFFGRTSEE